MSYACFETLKRPEVSSTHGNESDQYGSGDDAGPKWITLVGGKEKGRCTEGERDKPDEAVCCGCCTAGKACSRPTRTTTRRHGLDCWTRLFLTSAEVEQTCAVEGGISCEVRKKSAAAVLFLLCGQEEHRWADEMDEAEVILLDCAL